ncbi:MAG: enoyl-CoA hydratase-related protein [Pelagibacteraceae bacterium]|jgi:enoyl-CoA hydratase
MTDLVKIKKIGEYIVEVSLNRPEKLNALTKPMWKKLGSIFRDLASKKNKHIRCVILRGEGGKSFSPGNDIGEFEKSRSNSKLAKEYGVHLHGTLAAIQECPIPTVALIEGICVGGGFEIAACCDLRICGNSSRFGVPIKRLGLTMAPRELQALLGLVGRSTTMEILLEGKIFNSEEAYQKGMVNRVVPDQDVEKEAYATAERICDGAPLVARWHKAFADELLYKNKISNKLNNLGYKCYDTEDFQIGYKSFLTKTKPKFKNK